MFCRKKQANYNSVPSDDKGKPDNSKPVRDDVTELSYNHIARLMYYLHCVKTCVNVRIGDSLVDFKHFFLLTEAEKRDVVIYAHRFRPQVMKNVIFFLIDDKDTMLTSIPNKFLDANDPIVSGSFHLTSNRVIMEGSEHMIRKVMIHKPAWMYDYFEIPFREEQWRIGISPGVPYQFIGVTRSNYPASAFDVPFWCLGGLLWWFIFPPVGLACMAVGACRAGCEVARRHNQPMATTYVVVLHHTLGEHLFHDNPEIIIGQLHVQTTMSPFQVIVGYYLNEAQQIEGLNALIRKQSLLVDVLLKHEQMTNFKFYVFPKIDK